MASIRKRQRDREQLRRSHDQICSEAIEILKDQPVHPATLDSLCQMKPARQIEVARIIKATGNYLPRFGSALLAATNRFDLLKPDARKIIRELLDSDIATLEEGIRNLRVKITVPDLSYGVEVLHFVIARAYVAALISNPTLECYLQNNHRELLDGLQTIVAMRSLAAGKQEAAYTG